MRYGFVDIYNRLVDGYLDARRHERDTLPALAFEVDLERNLGDIARALHARSWHPSRMEWFVTDRPTIREIFAPSFPDRVVSHLLFNILSPISEHYLIHDTCSCRKGRGTLFGIERFEHHVRSITQNYSRPAWCLHVDISGYFMSIDQAVLRAIVVDMLDKEARKYGDVFDYGFTMWLVDEFLNREPTRDCVFVGNPALVPMVPKNKSLFGRPSGVGVPIGDVINQLFANLYLSPFDNYVKRTLKVRNYVRYVDDCQIFGADRERLCEIMAQCAAFLEDRLRLAVHPEKTTISSVYDAPDFLGAVYHPYRRYARRSAVDDARAALKRYDGLLARGLIEPADALAEINSRLGYLGHFSEWRAVDRALRRRPALLDAFTFNKNLTKATIRK
jgi:retron-type reverse transcriptase